MRGDVRPGVADWGCSERVVPVQIRCIKCTVRCRRRGARGRAPSCSRVRGRLQLGSRTGDRPEWRGPGRCEGNGSRFPERRCARFWAARCVGEGHLAGSAVACGRTRRPEVGCVVGIARTSRALVVLVGLQWPDLVLVRSRWIGRTTPAIGRGRCTEVANACYVREQGSQARG